MGMADPGLAMRIQARWAKKAHHMTMCLGEMREDLFTSVDKELYALGRVVELEVVAYGEVPTQCE